MSDSVNDKGGLNFLYRNFLGRCILKIITLPIFSKIAGKYMDMRLSKRHIKSFIKKNNINMSEYKRQKYRSFNDFFIREINYGKRPIPADPKVLMSPADSRLTAYEITSKSSFYIKGSTYKLGDLLGDKMLASRYEGGHCLIFRLSVDDYHRYCYIDNGSKGDNVFLKGVLHTVQPIALERYNIWKLNSREYTILETQNFGSVVHIEVGALMVGRIVNHHRAHKYKRGEEKGYFQFGGSTLVLLFKKGQIELNDEIIENSKKSIETRVLMGQSIGRSK